MRSKYRVLLCQQLQRFPQVSCKRGPGALVDECTSIGEQDIWVQMGKLALLVTQAYASAAVAGIHWFEDSVSGVFCDAAGVYAPRDSELLAHHFR